jgi:hypothetical protein
MTIKIIGKLTRENYEDTISFWNTNKVSGMGNLQILNSRNGGFQTYSVDSNNKIIFKSIHQLHWYSHYLVTFTTCPGFSEEEEFLLFKSLCFSIGRDRVLYYESFSSAYLCSPKINYIEDVNKSPCVPNAFNGFCYNYRTHIKI